MTKLTENDIELWAIEELESVGWNYKNGTKIAPASQEPERNSFSYIIRATFIADSIAIIRLFLDSFIVKNIKRKTMRLMMAMVNHFNFYT